MKVAIGVTRNGTHIVKVPLGDHEEPATAIANALKRVNRMDVYDRWVRHGRLTEVEGENKTKAR